MPAASSTPHSSGGIRAVVGRDERHRVLYLTTLAFCLTFVVWFDLAPFTLAVKRSLHLSTAQVGALILANLALAVPGRLLVGMLLDRLGPRRLFAAVLVYAAVPNTVMALAHSYSVLLLSRLALGLVGSGFVVGIRMVAEWFDDAEMGSAEGFYGGWGNFGSALAALVLPTLAGAIAGGPEGWRWGVAVPGIVGALYGLAYLRLVTDTPAGQAFARPARQGALPVSSRGGVAGLVALQLPIVGAMGLVTYRIWAVHVISTATRDTVDALLVLALLALVARVLWVNRGVLAGGQLPSAERYPFRSVPLLALTYLVTFGTELTMASLLPTFFASTFGLKIAAAGVAGSAFAFTNLVTRPAGGMLSDLLHRRRAVLAVLLAGAAVCFAAMTRLGATWPLAAGVTLVALASVFIQGGNGAVYAMTPLVRRDVTGQVAGIVGAYGNIGGLVFATVLFLTTSGSAPAGDTTALFVAVAVLAALMAVAVLAVPERALRRYAAPASAPVGRAVPEALPAA